MENCLDIKKNNFHQVCEQLLNNESIAYDMKDSLISGALESDPYLGGHLEEKVA